MAFTSQLGIAAAELANIELGRLGSIPPPQQAIEYKVPQRLGLPWLMRIPISEAAGQSIAPPPPAPVMTGTPLLRAAQGPKMLGIPWSGIPVTESSSIVGKTTPPTPPTPGPTTQLPWIPRFYPRGTDKTRQSRLQRHTDQVSQINNSLIGKLQLLQTGQTDWEIGYPVIDKSSWEGTPPTTMVEAFERIAAALAALGMKP
jgi:hypothetical protein